MHPWLGVLALLQFSANPMQFQTDIHSMTPTGAGQFWVTGKRGSVCRIELSPLKGSCSTLGEGLITAVATADDIAVAAGEGGAIFISHDQGRNWSPSNTSSTYHLLDVAILSPDRFMAVGDWGTVLRTDDGGQSWTERPLETKYGDDFLGVPILTRSITDPGTGQIYSAGSEIPPSAAATLVAAGHTFFVRNDVILNQILAAEDGTVYIAAERGKLFASADGSSPFVEVPLRKPSSVSLDEDGAEEGPTLFFVTGRSPVLWAGGSLGTLLRIQLAKKGMPPQVEKAHIPLEENAIFSADVRERTLCLAGSDGLMAFSFDGGATWDRVGNPAYDALWFRSALAQPDGSCLFAGQKGTIVQVKP